MNWSKAKENKIKYKNKILGITYTLVKSTGAWQKKY